MIRLPYGEVSAEMLDAIARTVRWKTAWDLMCGEANWAARFFAFGATDVEAVDKEDFDGHCTRAYLDAWQPRFKAEVAFLSWPVNRQVPGLVGLLEQVETVIVLSRNDDSTSCGWWDLWGYLATREVLGEIQDERNDLLVYGKPLGEARAPDQLRREEQAALAQHLALSRNYRELVAELAGEG